MDRADSVLNLFSVTLREMFVAADINFEKLMEIRLRSGQPLLLMYDGREYYLSQKGEMMLCTHQESVTLTNPYLIRQKEIQETLSYVSKYSMYAFEEEIRQGYITVYGGHRVGICGQAVMEEGKVKTIRYVSFINIRIAHQVRKCSDHIMKYLYREREAVYNTLILSPPMCGKTTLLRDIIRNISNGISGREGMNVGLADERSEIAAAYRGIPQNDVGIRTDVLDAMPKTYGIMMLIRTMSPRVIAVDEIGSDADARAILYGVHCGCRFIGTIHGDSVEEIRNKEYMKLMLEEGIFQRFIIMRRNDKGERRVQIYNERWENIKEAMV